MSTPSDAPKPISDLSPRVVSLAREIDRLPPGCYVITLTKPEVKALKWTAEISKAPETIRTMEIQKDV
jgi:hypothetical protein